MVPSFARMDWTISTQVALVILTLRLGGFARESSLQVNNKFHRIASSAGPPKHAVKSKRDFIDFTQ